MSHESLEKSIFMCPHMSYGILLPVAILDLTYRGPSREQHDYCCMAASMGVQPPEAAGFLQFEE